MSFDESSFNELPTSSFDPLTHIPPKYDIYGYLKTSNENNRYNILSERDKIKIPWEENNIRNNPLTRSELIERRKKERMPEIINIIIFQITTNIQVIKDITQLTLIIPQIKIQIWELEHKIHNQYLLFKISNMAIMVLTIILQLKQHPLIIIKCLLLIIRIIKKRRKKNVRESLLHLQDHQVLLHHKNLSFNDL